MSNLSHTKWAQVDAISALSTPRLRNILAYSANEAESDERLRTITTLIELPAFANEVFPDRHFAYLAKRPIEDVSRRRTQDDQSHDSIKSEPVRAIPDEPEASGRKETRTQTKGDTQAIEAEPGM